jgi:hypothetical protein
VLASALGEVDKAIEHLAASLDILEEIKDPRAGQVRGWLEDLQQQAGTDP